MFRALIATILLCLAAASVPSRAATPADVTSKGSDSPAYLLQSPDYDSEAERELLDLANSERARAGLSALKLDEGLVHAARNHAAEMAAQKKLSHQFSDEPSLVERIGANSPLHLNRAGENVAVAPNAEDAHAGLMSSPPHRDNLLGRNFNVAGFGVFRSGHWLYVTQDFGSSTPAYSVRQAQDLVSTSVEKLRGQARMPRLQRVENRYAQTSACSMAQADSLNGAEPPSGAYMLRYTSMQPETLPANVSKIIAQRGLHTYSAGTCYARTQKYPNGAYWVVLVFY
jgi:uncharacterized protein YkwD